MGAYQQLSRKSFSLTELSEQVESWKQAGDAVVFTNGVFDLLHTGHIDYLARAADLGQRLVIGVNSDDSVRRLNKGPARPIKDEGTRSLILRALEFVDATIVFDEDTPLDLINTIKPSVLVKGGDYDPNETDESSKTYMVGSKEVRSWEGEVYALSFVPGHSTTRLEEKIIEANLQ